MSKSFKKVVYPVILVVMLLLSSCIMPLTTEVVEETDNPIVITDVIGREVTLEKPATKLVGTHNPTLNAAVVLGGGGKYLVGFGNKEMSRGLYEQVIDSYDDLVQIGKGSTINFESVVAAGADLAILPERNQDLVPQFEEINLPAVVILDSTESFETVKQTLTLLGQVLGEDERAEQITAFLDAQLEQAQTLLKDTTERPSVLFLGASSQLSVAPAAMIQTSLIEAGGGTNAVSGVEGTGSFIEVNIEQIVAWNPDVIWYPAYSDYTMEDLLNDPTWSSINAIKNKQVFEFPSLLEPWDQPTAAVALGVDYALYSLHPDLYNLDSLMQDVDAFYTLVYGKTFTKEQLGIK
jgi:iron complex transport system substrate-binding protein